MALRGFGFVDTHSLPSAPYRAATLDCDGISWVTTGDFSARARHHCAAVFATNVALYFAAQGYGRLIVDDSAEATFAQMHRLIGNGPVVRVAQPLRGYFARRGYSLHYRSLRGLADVKRAIVAHHPVGLLLVDHPFSWHWVLGVGWRSYVTDSDMKPISLNVDTSVKASEVNIAQSFGPTDSLDYIRIVDGWNATAERYYQPHHGSWWFSGTHYWVTSLPL
ncbi:MAG: hypothetical protein Q4P66_09500 [Actinomycetaceae bacterium]|nr:hypothetical protein [Actinomycetaceae bacterium]